MLKRKLAVAVIAALTAGFFPLAQAESASLATAPASLSNATQSNAAPSVSSQSTSSQSTQDQKQDTSQPTEPAAQKKKARRLDEVVVSGTLINNTEIQTATPTYTISAADIQAHGFNSVQQVLQSAVQATGSVQGPQQSGGFTQGAQTVSLYGLNPEYTLTLIDGKPISQFGQLYNGSSNFTNISNIPISIIDHIDIIPGGGSSIYGSAAIAGVINIVTKEHMDGGQVTVRTGNYDGGGAAEQRIAFAFGHDFGNLNVLGALEFNNQSTLWAYQRSFTATSKKPTAVGLIDDFGSIDSGTYTGNVLGYVSPPEGCGAMGGLFDGSTYQTVSSVATRTGTFCGSKHVLGYTTLQNQSRSYDGLLKLKYDINDKVRLYSDILVDWQGQKFTPGSNYNFWGPIDSQYGGYIEDANTTDILYPERVFAPEEVGNHYYNQLGRQDDLMYQADLGAKGQFGESNWDWDVYFLRSGDRTTTSTPERSASAVDGYFNSIFGPSLGVDPNTGYNKYNPNYAAFFTPLTPAQYASFSQNVSGSSNTWVNNTRATVSNDALFSLPGGNAGFAFLLEGGSQAWYEPLNPLIANNEIWGLTGTGGGGTRSHYGSASELNLPLFKELTLDMSARYDHYKVSGGTNSKFTYKMGLEYRPFDTLLLRGNYATSFLAPDMAALFLGPSGNYQTVTDYYLCATQGGNNDCEANYGEQVKGSLYANKQLKPTTATSWTGGFVWAPVDRMSLSVDYLHIAIVNEVAPQSTDLLLKQEAQCRLNQLSADSTICRTALAQVTRDPLTGQVANIAQYYVNVSNEVTDSLTAEAKYKFQPTSFGQFGLQLDYNDMLKHAYQIYPGSEPINQLTNPLYSSEFKTIVSGALSWSLNDSWSSTLYGHRYSPTPNYIALVDGAGYKGAGRVAPWITWNWSLTYTPIKGLDLSLLVNNVFNKMPPNDPTYSSFPYYNTQNYNVYGREVMAQVDWKFGGSNN